ncbi:unnamed protein product [Dibothriocephalus latus]|uniref:Uncharacterized protein n=1 Tax=Dibothriocephalus latus TaxID=60516 RepID=A0A3P6RHN5_DIBLA|nr:unnamed protein product [Dibothriocephalus latus]
MERFLRLHLALAGLFDSSGTDQVFCWADEVVGVATALATEDTQSPAAAATSSSQFVLPYPRADLLRLHCLIDAVRVRHAALPEQRTVEQGACFEKLLNLLEAVDTSAAAATAPESLTDVNSGEGLVHLQISSDLQLLEILELALKLWLYDRLREMRQPTTDKQSSVDAALLIMILHQSTAWSKLLVQLNSEMLQELMKVIKADWTAIRARILSWLKSGFIVDASLLAQLVHIESEAGSDT